MVSDHDYLMKYKKGTVTLKRETTPRSSRMQSFKRLSRNTEVPEESPEKGNDAEDGADIEAEVAENTDGLSSSFEKSPSPKQPKPSSSLGESPSKQAKPSSSLEKSPSKEPKSSSSLEKSPSKEPKPSSSLEKSPASRQLKLPSSFEKSPPSKQLKPSSTVENTSSPKRRRAEGSTPNNFPVYDNRFYNRIRELPFDLMLSDRDQHLCCTEVPYLELDGGDARTESYLVDKSIPVCDLPVDGLGGWCSGKTNTTKHNYFLKNGKSSTKEDCDLIIEKRYGKHGSVQPPNTLRKIIWSLKTVNGTRWRSLITYKIDKGAHLVLKPHGNRRKSSVPYERTFPSLLRKITDLRQTSPSSTASLLLGENIEASSADRRSLPRNKSQIYNRCRSKVQALKRYVKSGEMWDVEEIPGTALSAEGQWAVEEVPVVAATGNRVLKTEQWDLDEMLPTTSKRVKTEHWAVEEIVPASGKRRKTTEDWDAEEVVPVSGRELESDGHWDMEEVIPIAGSAPNSEGRWIVEEIVPTAENRLKSDGHWKIAEILRMIGDGFAREVNFYGKGERIMLATNSMLEGFRLSCIAPLLELEEKILSVTPPRSMIGNTDLSEFYHSADIVSASKQGPSPVYVSQLGNVAGYYITVFAYRHKAFQNVRTEENPVCVAAIFLTTHQEAEDYFYCAENMWRACGTEVNARVRSFVTSEDERLASIAKCPLFSSPAIHLQSAAQLKESTKNKLKELGVDVDSQRSISKDIYGSEKVVGKSKVRKEGLIDAVSEKQFDVMLLDLKREWENIDKNFVSDFCDRQADLIKNGFLLSSRIKGGLGDTIPTTEDIDAVNNMIKGILKTCHSSATYHTLTDLHDFMKEEFASLAPAITGSSPDFKLSSEYVDHWCSDDLWRGFSAEEQESRLADIGIFENRESLVPRLFKSLYPLAEWKQLYSNARDVYSNRRFQKFDEDATIYFLRMDNKTFTIQVCDDGYLNCECSEERPICAHNLAIAISLEKESIFLEAAGARVGEVSGRPPVHRIKSHMDSHVVL